MVFSLQVEGDLEREFWRRQQAQAAAQEGSWVSHVITVTLTSDGTLSVSEEEEEVADCKVSCIVSLGQYETQALPVQESVVYELCMVVAHVRESWMEAPGNLVAHIRVSPFYHARKQVTTLCNV